MFSILGTKCSLHFNRLPAFDASFRRWSQIPKWKILVPCAECAVWKWRQLVRFVYSVTNAQQIHGCCGKKSLNSFISENIVFLSGLCGRLQNYCLVCSISATFSEPKAISGLLNQSLLFWVCNVAWNAWVILIRSCLVPCLLELRNDFIIPEIHTKTGSRDSCEDWHWIDLVLLLFWTQVGNKRHCSHSETQVPFCTAGQSVVPAIL